MRKYFSIFIASVLIILGASQFILAGEVTSDPKRLVFDKGYLKILESKGSSFEKKKEYLQNTAIREEIQATIERLGDLMQDSSEDLTLEYDTVKLDTKTISIYTSSKPKHRSKEQTLNSASKERIELEIDRQVKAKLPVYVVQPGDQLEDLAQTLSLDITTLIMDNHLKYEGQTDQTLPNDPSHVNTQEYYPLVIGDVLIGVLPAEPPITGTAAKTISKHQQRLLKGMQHKAIEQIQNEALILSPDQLQAIYDQIYLAQDKQAIEKIVEDTLHHTSDKELIQKGSDTIVVDSSQVDIESEKTSAINKLISYPISQEQYNQWVAEIRNAQTLEEIDYILTLAQSIANEQTTSEPVEDSQEESEQGDSSDNEKNDEDNKTDLNS